MSAMDQDEGMAPEPDDALDDEDELEARRQEEAFARHYENENTWEALQEDEHGLLRVDQTLEQRAKRQRTLLSAAQSARIRKGMIRYLLLVIDVSAAAAASDLRPSRLGCMLRAARDFVRAFFDQSILQHLPDQNPLSQLGILLMRDGRCERLTELSGSPEAQVRRLEAAALGAEGPASLQNALDASIALLRHIPPYGHREMLLLFAALSTVDPGNIFDSIKAAKEARIRVSVVGVAAEVFVCRRMSDETGGTYGVALNEGHLEELLMAHAPPPPAVVGSAGAELVRMGFPQRGPSAPASAVFVGPDARLAAGSYACPRCAGRVAELPGECHVCGLTLISSPHLARSYHHLFPVPPYVELKPEEVEEEHTRAQAATAAAAGEGDGLPGFGDMAGGMGLQGSILVPPEVPGSGLHCFGCLTNLSGGQSKAYSGAGQVLGAAAPLVLKCPQCRHLFCFECDAYVHESLHNCPGCM